MNLVALLNNPLTLEILGGIAGLGVLGYIAFVIYQHSPRGKMRKRIARLKSRKPGSGKKSSVALTLRRQPGQKVSPLLAAMMSPLPNMAQLDARIQRAGSKLDSRQFIFRCLLAALIVTVTFKLIGKSILLGFFVGLIVAVWLPIKVLDFKINKQKKKFLLLFPDAIDMIVRGLRSGLPVSESITLVAHEVPEPVAGTFTHVSNTMKLGVPMEKALQEVAKQLGYTEFNFFVTSIILQRETGGNLSEILNNLSEVLRKRFLMHMKIRAMTSEARASAIIIGALPFMVIGAVSVMSPDYIKPLFTDYRGNIAGLIAAGFMSTGIFTMRRMSKFEI